MTSLTQVAITTRKTIRYGIFLVIGIIIARLLIIAGINIYKKIFPPPPPAPTVTFGKLPKLPFPLESSATNFSLSLETAEGVLPTFYSTAKVYYMPKLPSNLLALDLAKQKAASLGYAAEPEQISDTIYKFTSINFFSTLEMNIVTGTFSITYDLKSDPTPLDIKPPVPEVAASLVRSYLSAANLLPSDLTGETKHEFLKIEGDKFVPALSLSDASVIKIHFFRKNFEDFPSMTSDPNKANVWYLVSGANEREKKIVAAEFHYFPVDESQFSTYPIKTADQAWSELTNGGGYIASFGVNKEGDNIKIRKVYLAYYDPGVATEFYQPIIVFEGDKGFIAYVPAVTSDYYGE